MTDRDSIKEAVKAAYERFGTIDVLVNNAGHGYRAAVGSAVGSGYYAATKAALELLSDALYQEVTPLGIKVMVVEPGQFRTRFFDDSLKGTHLKITDYENYCLEVGL